MDGHGDRCTGDCRDVSFFILLVIDDMDRPDGVIVEATKIMDRSREYPPTSKDYEYC